MMLPSTSSTLDEAIIAMLNNATVMINRNRGIFIFNFDTEQYSCFKKKNFASLITRILSNWKIDSIKVDQLFCCYSVF